MSGNVGEWCGDWYRADYYAQLAKGGSLAINPKGPDGGVVAPEAATDYHNADPALRGRKLVGMPLIWGFKATADPKVFEGGQIYNASNGKTYNANITLQPDGRLSLRGYVGSPMFGETQIWTRIN